MTPGVATSVTIYNGLAYTADGGSGLQVINYLPYDNKNVAPTIALSTSPNAAQVIESTSILLKADARDECRSGTSNSTWRSQGRHRRQLPL